MAVNDFIVASDLCKRHRTWRKQFPNAWDYLTLFCDDFANYLNKPNRHKHGVPYTDNTWHQLQVKNNNMFIFKNGEIHIMGLILNMPYRERLGGFCDITDYLKYITTQNERRHCILGLWRFMEFGGVVRIGNKDFTFFDSTELDNEILKLTPHI